jgi:vibriolysin
MNTCDLSRRTGLPVLAASACALLLAVQGNAAPLDPKLIPRQMTAAQIDAVRSIPDLQAIAVDKAAIPAHIRGELGTFRSEAAVRDTDAAAFLEGMRKVLRAHGSESLKLRKSERDAARGMSHHRMTQTIDGLEVIGGEMILHVEDATSRVLSLDAQFLPGGGLPRTPSIEGSKAIDSALKSMQAVKPKRSTEPRLAFARTADGKGHLVWVARVRYMDPQGAEQLDDILADAITGKLVQRLPRIHHALNRRVNDERTGALLIAEGGTTTDIPAAKAYEYSGDTYNFFWSSYGRDSFNGRGGTMQCYVYSSVGNARYEEGATYYDDGDGVDYSNTSHSRDIVVHEWVHGVSESEANFAFIGEPAMLNEMMSDVFAATVDATINGVTPNTWKFGEEVYTPQIPDDAIRYMNNPRLEYFSRDFYPDLTESTGAHGGAGVGDLAFYLMATGGTHPRGKTTNVVNSIGIEPAARIYYLALRDYLLTQDGYVALAEKTARVAQEQYGAGSAEHSSVCSAWTAVGVPHSGSYCPAP